MKTVIEWIKRLRSRKVTNLLPPPLPQTENRQPLHSWNNWSKPKKKLFNARIARATFGSLAGYLQYTFAYIMALAYTTSLVYTLQQYVDEGDDHIRSTLLSWLYAFVMMALVSTILVCIERKGVRKRLEGKPGFLRRYWFQMVELLAATIHLMAAFAFPYAIALTVQNQSGSVNLNILFGYALAVTLVSSLVIIWVQIQLAEAKEEFEKKKTTKTRTAA